MRKQKKKWLGVVLTAALVTGCSMNGTGTLETVTEPGSVETPHMVERWPEAGDVTEVTTMAVIEAETEAPTEPEVPTEVPTTLSEEEQAREWAKSPDSLVSWAPDSVVKQQIVDFVTRAVDPNSDGYIPVEDRIVASDIDGTLIPEMGNNIHNIDVAGLTPYECRDYILSVADGYFDANKGFQYGHMVYAPMKELFDYLEANDFDIYYVSGATNCLAYSWANIYFNAEYSHVIGTQQIFGYHVDEQGNYSLTYNGYDVEHRNWLDVKTYRFYDRTAKQPVLAFGNSGGDEFLLWWAQSHPQYRGLAVMINHDDAVREYNYDVDVIANLCQVHGFLDCRISRDFGRIIFER